MTNKKINFSEGAGTRYGIDALESHCATLNAYNWVKASGKQYIIAKDDTGRHYLDLRYIKPE